MNFAIGDAVVHWTHGLGSVIAIEEMQLAGNTQQYYVVEIAKMKLWVTVQEADKGSIRRPGPSVDFKALFQILKNSGKLLPENAYQRRIELRERMQKRTLEEVCQVIRDLTDRASAHALNLDDSAVLLRAEEHLVDEWMVSLGTERSFALRELKVLLAGTPPAPSGI